MRDTLFMSEVLASVTHEMQNVIAIIRESGALSDDILRLNGPPRMKHGDKLLPALTNIQEQTDRGRRLMLMLNDFAHAAVDYPKCADLLRFTRQICVLAERMARLKECRLQVHLDAPELEVAPPHLLVRGNALLLMQSVYCGIEQVLQVCAANDVIKLRLLAPVDTPFGQEQQGPVLRIKAENSRAQPDAGPLESIMAELGGASCPAEGQIDLLYMSAEHVSHAW